MNLKNEKSDPVLQSSSDMLKNIPDAVFVHLANLLQAFLVHGYVTQALLIATMVPIVKDKLGSKTSSKNYRSIAPAWFLRSLTGL
jgi:hypothetical protein